MPYLKKRLTRKQRAHARLERRNGRGDWHVVQNAALTKRGNGVQLTQLLRGRGNGWRAMASEEHDVNIRERSGA